MPRTTAPASLKRIAASRNYVLAVERNGAERGGGTTELARGGTVWRWNRRGWGGEKKKKRKNERASHGALAIIRPLGDIANASAPLVGWFALPWSGEREYRRIQLFPARRKYL